jgi:hypothetical protein
MKLRKKIQLFFLLLKLFQFYFKTHRKTVWLGYNGKSANQIWHILAYKIT